MKTYKNTKFFHGIMFHHFHDQKKYSKTQGSIDKNQFEKIIKYIDRRNILDAKKFFIKMQNEELTSKDLCLTFDDGIKSQIDLALPILKKYKIKAFFFIPSSIFSNNPDLLEVYRYFRNKYFKNINDFYNQFFTISKINMKKFSEINKKKIKIFKIKHKFYSLNDIKFRLIRDTILTKNKYNDIMEKLFKIYNFKKNNHYNKLFLNKNDVKKIIHAGHVIGLHSHTHPTQMAKLSFQKQFNEYQKNKNCLLKIIGTKNKNTLNSMSHPCGNYNQDTKIILNKLNIEIGFRSSMSIDKKNSMKKINNSKFEIAREDHANIISKIYKK
jgi:peptidoglycan/xylan/chitin deacetylase (PgdA/CDA1 family)